MGAGGGSGESVHGGTVFLGIGGALWPFGQLRFDEDAITFRPRWLPWPWTRLATRFEREDVAELALRWGGLIVPWGTLQAIGPDGEALGRRGRFDRRGAMFVRRIGWTRLLDELRDRGWPVDEG